MIKHDLRVDFLSGPLLYRRKYGGGFGQLLARAVGVKPNKQLTVIDATAGLGRDAFVDVRFFSMLIVGEII